MAKPDDEKTKIMRITHLVPGYVSLVDMGANHGGERHHFSLKGRDAEVPPALVCLDCRTAILEKAADAPTCPSCGSDHVAVVVKVVPDDDATDDEKQAALEARAKRYGIEVRDDAHLTYPADAPTSESLFADPVNLAYPLGKAGNDPDTGRIRNAISLFKGNHETYTQETSKARVYERIVRAALREDIEVSYDPEDEIDQLLPADLREALEKNDDDTEKNADTPPAPEPVAAPDAAPAEPPATPAPAATDDASWLGDAAARVDSLEQQMALDQRLAAVEEAVADSPAPAAPDAPTEKRLSEENLRSQLEAERARADKAEADLRKARQASEARASQRVTAGSARRPGAYATAESGGTAVQWGHDLSAEVAAGASE